MLIVLHLWVGPCGIFLVRVGLSTGHFFMLIPYIILLALSREIIFIDLTNYLTGHCCLYYCFNFFLKQCVWIIGNS